MSKTTALTVVKEIQGEMIEADFVVNEAPARKRGAPKGGAGRLTSSLRWMRKSQRRSRSVNARLTKLWCL